MSRRSPACAGRRRILLPPDMREWVPGDDMVHVVLEAAEEMKEKLQTDTGRALYARRKQTKSRFAEQNLLAGCRTCSEAESPTAC